MSQNEPEDKLLIPGNQRMSVIPARAVSDPELSDGAFRTLAALGIFGDQNGWCYPSYATLARIRGLSKSAIAKHIAELVERGYLNVHHRYDGVTGAQRASMLQIRFDYAPDPDDKSGYVVKKVEPKGEARNTVEASSRFRGGNPPYTSEVNGGYTSEVNPPYTSEVNPPYTLKGERLTSHINDPFNDPFNGVGVKHPVSVEETPPPPPFPLQSKNSEEDPTERYLKNAETLYRRLRPSHLMIPRSRWYEEALRVLNDVLERNGGDFDAAELELRPYVEESDARGYAPANLFWLTEWAATGYIPPRAGKNSDRSSTSAGQDDEYGDPYGINRTPAQNARRQSLALRIAKLLKIDTAKAREFVEKYGPHRWVEILELYDELEKRGIATVEVFEFLAYLYVPVEKFKLRLEQGAKTPEELFADYQREYQGFYL
jgi:hypothetical protein